MSEHHDVIQQLIDRRHELGMTQIDVDLALDKNSRCGKWESGIRVPQLDNLVLWCGVLNLKIKLEPIERTDDDGQDAKGQGRES